MLHRSLRAAALACSMLVAPALAFAGPISGYPAASTPLSGTETVIGTQSATTVQVTTQSIANLTTTGANTWTGVQTFPAPGSNKGSIVLTPGTVSGTPPNGSLWTTTGGFFAEIGGTTMQFAPLGSANAWTGKQTFATSGASAAGVNLGQGSAPTSPVNGDLWITSSGLFAEIGGAPVQFITASSFSWPAKQSFTASTSGLAGVNFGVGVDPSAPANGDIWLTNSGVFARVNGVTAALGVTVPTAAAGGSNTQVQYNCSAVLCGATGFGYATTGHTLTGPDGTTWATVGGVTVGSSSKIDLNGTALFSGSAVLIWEPNCLSPSNSTWLVGTSSNFCSHVLPGGTDNLSFGTVTLDALTTGFGNLAFGSETLKALTTGSFNACFGFEACHVVTTGSDNAVLGPALSAETTGSDNTAVGPTALNNQNGASNNTGVGAGAGAVVTTGGNNTLIGFGAANALTTGSHNIVLTDSGGPNGISTGGSNVYIGHDSAGFGCVFAAAVSNTITLYNNDGNDPAIVYGYNPNTCGAAAGTLWLDSTAGVVISNATGGAKGASTVNLPAVFENGTAGVTCSGAPTGSFAVANGIVTHC